MEEATQKDEEDDEK